MDSLLIYGGTFDPIHNGHLNTAINVQKKCHFDRFLFMPCKAPVLKKKSLATPSQRIDMLHLAIQEYPSHHFEVDTREIIRPTPSYMFTSLQEFRDKSDTSRSSITLLMGMDAFLLLPSWYQWKALLTLCNILVIERPGTYELSAELTTLLSIHETFNPSALKISNGLIYRFNAGLYDLSSSIIRQAIKQHEKYNAFLPPLVLAYIQKNGLYLSES